MVGQARKRGLVKDRLRLTDATHIIGSIAVPRTLELLAQLRDRMLILMSSERNTLKNAGTVAFGSRKYPEIVGEIWISSTGAFCVAPIPGASAFAGVARGTLFSSVSIVTLSRSLGRIQPMC